MKICFFTEMDFVGKIPRDHRNMRTEFAWMNSLNGDHYPLFSITENTPHWDLGIIILPKKHIERLMRLDVLSLKSRCKKIAIMQEGPHWLFQDWPIQYQVWYYNFLMEMDFLLCHNEIDVKYYRGITGKRCYVLPPLMITDYVRSYQNDKRRNVMIGGNFCYWYSGFDSYIVALTLGCQVYIPSMGRRVQNEELMENLNHLPYMNWIEWMKKLSEFKYAIHLMRTHAAGTFALNCSYLGIPCIGYANLDTQRLLHPNLSIDDVGDLDKAKSLALKLKNDQNFYKFCSENTKHLYEDIFSESRFKKRINNIFYEEKI